MASSRDLERRLTQVGYSAVRLDSCNRLLREAGRIPSLGRGLNAAQIDASAAAAVLLAYQGSTRAVKAVERLRKLEGLRSADGQTLLATMRNLLEGSAEAAELRISRIGKRARLIERDGTTTFFSKDGEAPVGGGAEVEGVIDGSMFRNICELLKGCVSHAPKVDENDDAE